MRLHRTAIIAIVFLLLAGFYYYFEVVLHSEKEKIQRQKRLIFPFQEDEVEEITITREKDSIHLKKRNDHWQILKPVVANGDNTFIKGLLRTLTKAEIERIVDENPPELEPFGLKSPGLKLEIKIRGKGAFSLFFGERSPTEVFHYAKRGEENKVFLVFDRMRNELEQPLFAFREKEFVRLIPDSIQRISINHAGMRYAVEKDVEGHWKVVAPIKTRGDDEVINRFLQRIKDTRIKDFVDSPVGGLSRLGLDPPLFEVQASSPSGHISIMLGKVKEGEKMVYAKLPQSKEVVLLDQEVMDFIPKGLYDLRNKQLIHIDREKVRKIEWDYGDHRIVCTRTGEDQWNIQEPERFKADFFAINDILWSLKDARIKEFFDYNPKVLPKGDEFKTVHLRIGIWEEGKERERWLIMGKEDPAREGIFVRIEGEKDFYLADKSLKVELTKTPFDLRDKSLFNIERKDVFRIQATVDNKRYVLERSGKNWKVLEPIRSKGDPRKAEAILTSIGLLKFKVILDNGQVRDENCGLESPAFEFTLFDKKGKELCHLQAGRVVPWRGNGIVCVRTGDRYPLYGIEAKMMDEIKKELEELIQS